MAERVYEHMVNVTLGSWTFRFWIAAKPGEFPSPRSLAAQGGELNMFIRALLGFDDGFQTGQFNAMQAAQKLADGIENLNAVEVLDPMGNGARVGGGPVVVPR